MKNLFITIFTILSVASVGTYMSLPEKKSVVPIIYWVTDANPERVRQVEVFEKWQIDNGHLGPDGGPAVKVMVDTDNGGHKKIIQGVSGVAADVMDIGGNQLNYFKQMGFLENITEIAEEKGFSYKTTWPAISELLTEVNPETGLREQYLYPCNIGASALWVNKNAFTRLGLEPPSTLITIEEFEKLAK